MAILSVILLLNVYVVKSRPSTVKSDTPNRLYTAVYNAIRNLLSPIGTENCAHNSTLKEICQKCEMTHESDSIDILIWCCANRENVTDHCFDYARYGTISLKDIHSLVKLKNENN